MSEGKFEKVLNNQDVIALAFAALISAIGIALLYMPGSPATLIWPYEWALVLSWVVLGLVFYLVARRSSDADAVRLKLEGLQAGHTPAASAD